MDAPIPGRCTHGAMSDTITQSNCLLFWSRGPATACALSNFALPVGDRPLEISWPETPLFPPHLQGRTVAYPTREHAFQSLRGADIHTSLLFATDGALGSWDCFKAWPAKKGVFGATENVYAKMRKAWAGKGMFGVAAKMAVGLDPRRAMAVFRARFEELDKTRGRDVMLRVWGPILRAHVAPGTPEAAHLDGTGDVRLVEYSMRARPDSFYNAKFVRGELVGQNNTGLFLEEIRWENRHY